MNNKVIFWCKPIGENTTFYNIVTNADLSDYENDVDEILVHLGIVEELVELSKYGGLENWGVIEVKETEEDTTTTFNIDKTSKKDVLSDNEKKILELEAKVKSLEKKSNNLKENAEKWEWLEDLDKQDADFLETIQGLLRAKLALIDTILPNKKEEKKVAKRKELLNTKGFVSESGWIDRSGKYWNVQGVDHDDVAEELWGSSFFAEKINIRISSTMYGTYIMYDFRNSLKPPNKKQINTLIKWGEKFNFENKVSHFLKNINELYD